MIWIIDVILLFACIMTTNWERVRAKIQDKIEELEKEEEK